MDALEIHTPVGEITPLKVIHGTAINATVRLYADPEGWFYKQFLALEDLENYALDNNLIIKRTEE